MSAYANGAAVDPMPADDLSGWSMPAPDEPPSVKEVCLAGATITWSIAGGGADVWIDARDAARKPRVFPDGRTHVHLEGPTEELARLLVEARRLARTTVLPDARPVDANAPWASRVSVCDVSWFETKPPRRDYLLRDTRTAERDGVIVRGKTGMIISEGGLGKTTFLAQALVALATGTRLLGCYEPPQACRVFGAFGEEDLPELRRKVFYASRSAGLDWIEEQAIVTLPLAGMTCSLVESDLRGNPVDAPFFVWLRGFLMAERDRRGPFSALALDPLSRFAGLAAEIDNAAATRFVQALESLVEPSGGAAVICAHHVNKTSRGAGATVSGASARGSSAIYDGVRWVAALSTERVDMGEGDAFADLTETVTFEVVKSNYSRKGDPVVLRRDTENGGALVPLDPVEREIISKARQAAEPSARRRAAREEHGKARTATLADAIRQALADSPAGLTYRGLRGVVRATAGGCSDAALDAALAHLGPAIARRSGPRGATVHCLADTTEEVPS